MVHAVGGLAASTQPAQVAAHNSRGVPTWTLAARALLWLDLAHLVERDSMRLRSLLIVAALTGCGDDPTPDDSDVAVDTSSDLLDDIASDTAGSDTSDDADVPLDSPDGAADTSVDADNDASSDASDTGDSGDVEVPEFITYLYDPFGPTLTTLPDDALTVPDESSETGIRIAFGEQHPWFSAAVGLQRGGLTALDGLDGWGINAAIALVFDAPVGELPSGESSAESDSLMLMELGESPRALPYEVVRTEDGSFLMVPMFPLKPSTRHGVIGTTQIEGADGRPIVPGPTMTSLLNGEASGPLEPMNERYAELLEATDLEPEDAAFATVFTTQAPLAVSRDVAAQIRTMEFSWNDISCEDASPGGVELRHCETGFDAWSWRDEEGVLGDGQPVRRYTLPVSIWLPPGPGPHPTAVFGHGLAHGRDVSRTMAELVVPLGVAVVAIDAVAHGEHPDAPEDDAMVLFEFFALSLSPLDHNPRILRDNFRQSTWDKLQLLRLLELAPDVDGGPDAEFDLGDMIYLGESFGGVMAIEFLALTNRFSAAGLQLGGGSVVRIIGQARRFEAVRLLAGGSTAPETIRFFPIVQAVVDAGDASTWAPRILRDRLPEIGGEAPHLLLQLVINDDTIPDASTDSVVRALGLEHLPPVARELPLAPTTEAAPISGNLDGNTGVFFQYDRVRRGPDSDIEVATHDYTPGSIEARHQLREFVRTWLESGTPTVVDPFEELDTPEL